MNILNSASSHWLIQSIGLPKIEDLIEKNKCLLKSFTKGQTIHHVKDDCLYFELILSGTLSVNRFDSEGNVVHISMLQSGETVGGILLYATDSQYPFDVLALEDTQLLQIEKHTLIVLLQESPDLLTHFLRDVSDKSLLLTQTIHTLSEKALRQKILQYLLYEYETQQTESILVKPTKKLLAERFGVARTSLSRELKTMQNEGFIRLDGPRIHLLFLHK